MRLNVTLSAYREMEQVPPGPYKTIGEAILRLAENPQPEEASEVIFGSCNYLDVNDYFILYHVDDEEITVLGVLNGSFHPLH